MGKKEESRGKKERGREGWLVRSDRVIMSLDDRAIGDFTMTSQQLEERLSSLEQ
jgi:hypothetical protein